MIHRIALALVALVAIVTFASSAQADSAYAFAVQPVGCTPGYVHINHEDALTWSLDGAPVETRAPATNFPFSGGFQGDATASDGTVYYLTVNAVPSSCYSTPPSPVVTEPEAQEPTVDVADVIADLKVSNMTLTAHISNLERTIRQQDRKIARLEARVERLRSRR